MQTPNYKRYNLIHVNDEIIALSTSYASMLTELPYIESELRTQNYSGSVLFDLVLSNGLVASNRFLRIDFNGHTFDTKSTRTVNEKSDTISHAMRHTIYSFYADNSDTVENSSLSKTHQHILTSGLLLPV